MSLWRELPAALPGHYFINPQTRLREKKRNFRVSGWQCMKSWQGDKIPRMLLVLLAKQKNEEESLFWQCLAGKAVIPVEVVLPTPATGGQAPPPLLFEERGVKKT